MEAKAALECVGKIWKHEWIKSYIEVICIDDDATTKAYLAHCFKDLLDLGLPRPTTKKGLPKTARDDKGQLPKEHPIISFLADLSHRIHTFAKYLYALKIVGRKQSEMTDVDCLRLKRNFAWWLFSGIGQSYTGFKESRLCPVLHHFNDHSQCGTWCRHKDKSDKQLGKLNKYRCKLRHSKLFGQCMEIIAKFVTEEHLQECHHKTSSQKNEAMNKSIMRYAPKDKTLCASMSLTSRISLAVAIDTLGHAEYFERLFQAARLRPTELTFSGLRAVTRKKEYHRMRQGLSSVKLDRRLAKRTKMLLGLEKQEKDFQEGRGYASGIRIQGAVGIRLDGPGGSTTTTANAPGESSELRLNGPGGSTTTTANAPGGSTTMAIGPPGGLKTTANAPGGSTTTAIGPPGGLKTTANGPGGGSTMTTDEPGGKKERNQQTEFGEPTMTKRAKTIGDKNNNNSSKTRRTSCETCKCGGGDHKRVLSKECPWNGLSRSVILEKCAERNKKNENQVKETRTEIVGGIRTVCTQIGTVSTMVPTGSPSLAREEIVQFTTNVSAQSGAAKVQFTSK